VNYTTLIPEAPLFQDNPDSVFTRQGFELLESSRERQD